MAEEVTRLFGERDSDPEVRKPEMTEDHYVYMDGKSEAILLPSSFYEKAVFVKGSGGSQDLELH